MDQDARIEIVNKKPLATNCAELRLARYYQSQSRAALARFLGVSLARVTQVLNHLKANFTLQKSRS